MYPGHMKLETLSRNSATAPTTGAPILGGGQMDIRGGSGKMSAHSPPSSPPALPASSVAALSTSKKESHSLQNKFMFWFMRRGGAAGKPSQPTEYEKSIKKIGGFNTVEGFWQVYNHLIRPNDVPHTTDYHLFRDGIKPIWEDPANKRGGKWIVRLRKGLASRYWESIILAMIGEQFDVGNEICGAVISVRYNEDILALWNRNADNDEANNKIRDSMRKILRLPGFVKIEYKPHDLSMQDKSSFRNTSVWRNNRSRDRDRDRDQPSWSGQGRGNYQDEKEKLRDMDQAGKMSQWNVGNEPSDDRPRRW